VLRALIYPALAIGGAALYQVPGFILGQAVALLLVSLAGRTTSTVTWRPRFDWARGASLIRIGFPIMLVGFVHSLFATVDRWVVAAYLGPEPLGHYSLAIMALSAVALVPQVISQQFYPRMAFAWSADRDAQRLRRLAGNQRLLSFAFVVPLVVLLVVAAPPLVRWLLPAYVAGIPPLVVTLLVPLASTIGEGYGNVLNVLDKQTWYLYAIVLAVAVNLGVSFALVGPLGLVGVAWGTFAAFAVLALLRVLLGATALRRAERQTGAGA
jgi:O-antigen/teichoic acid export membrane protein